MDSELKARIAGVVDQLATQEQQRLRSAGTFIEIEELACEIGDEVARQLMQGKLVEQCNEAAESESQVCPDCGQATSSRATKERTLDSSRGTVEYFEPAYHCPSCRRDFFPGSRIDRLGGAGHDNSEVDREVSLGGE